MYFPRPLESLEFWLLYWISMWLLCGASKCPTVVWHHLGPLGLLFGGWGRGRGIRSLVRTCSRSLAGTWQHLWWPPGLPWSLSYFQDTYPPTPAYFPAVFFRFLTLVFVLKHSWQKQPLMSPKQVSRANLFPILQCLLPFSRAYRIFFFLLILRRWSPFLNCLRLFTSPVDISPLILLEEIVLTFPTDTHKARLKELDVNFSVFKTPWTRIIGHFETGDYRVSSCLVQFIWTRNQSGLSDPPK